MINMVKGDANNKKLGSCGVPIPGTICKVVSTETGEPLGPNTPGELCIKVIKNKCNLQLSV